MQTLSRVISLSFPSGATDVTTQEFTTTTTLTVTESTLTADHFRVVYATTHNLVQESASTAVGFMPVTITQSSTGTLTIDAQAMGGEVLFSLDFNNNGTAETIVGATTKPGSGFAVGSLSGLLAAD
jgi:hypothetical protein